MTIEIEVGNIVQVVDDRNLVVINQGNVVEVAALGAQGIGVPTGGTTGQALVKTSATDYATAWSSIWEDDQVVLAGQVFG